MKNDYQNNIKIGRNASTHKTLHTDILVNTDVVENNQSRMAKRPQRKRRVNYTKKIMNDSFLFNV